MGQVVQFPEPWWAFTFVDMLPHQIWTDEAVGRVVILAPIPDYREALAWAKLRVPGQMMLVEVDRI